jgi:hypothetical protein
MSFGSRSLSLPGTIADENALFISAHPAGSVQAFLHQKRVTDCFSFFSVFTVDKTATSISSMPLPSYFF